MSARDYVSETVEFCPKCGHLGELKPDREFSCTWCQPIVNEYRKKEELCPTKKW